MDQVAAPALQEEAIVQHNKKVEQEGQDSSLGAENGAAKEQEEQQYNDQQRQHQTEQPKQQQQLELVGQEVNVPEPHGIKTPLPPLTPLEIFEELVIAVDVKGPTSIKTSYIVRLCINFLSQRLVNCYVVRTFSTFRF